MMHTLNVSNVGRCIGSSELVGDALGGKPLLHIIAFEFTIVCVVGPKFQACFILPSLLPWL